MTFEEFIEEIKFYLANEFGHDPAGMRFLPKGMVAHSDNEELIISDANLRYFNDESKELLGNFLITEFPEGPISTSCKYPTTIERFNLDSLYERCQREGFNSVLEQLRKGKEESELSKKSDTVENLDSYEATKAKLILRPLNYKSNRNILKEYIYRRVGDIALVVYMIIADDDNNYMTAKLHRATFDVWNVSEEDVITEALKNSQRLHPAKAAKVSYDPDPRTGIPTPRFVDLGLLKDVPAAEFKNVGYISLFGQKNPNGAITLFFPGMMDWLYEKVGGAYYVVFTSIADVAIHSVKMKNIKELKFKLNHVNANINRPGDILSRKVYKYNGVELLEM